MIVDYEGLVINILVCIFGVESVFGMVREQLCGVGFEEG